MNATQRPLDFVTALGDQMPGRKVKITFKHDAVRTGPAYLIGMARSKVVSMSPGHYSIMLAVMESHDWNGDKNRTTIVTLGEEFEGRLSRELESIAHVP